MGDRPAAAGAASTITSSEPPPPPWYKDFQDVSNPQERNPPPIPESTYTCFGWPQMSIANERKGTLSLPPLDSDTKLYQADADLKDEFKRLFDQMVLEVLNYLHNLASALNPKAKNPGSTIQNIIKIYKNLQHILELLRYWEAKDEVVAHLRRQRDTKKELLDAIEHCLSTEVDDGFEKAMLPLRANPR